MMKKRSTLFLISLSLLISCGGGGGGGGGSSAPSSEKMNQDTTEVGDTAVIADEDILDGKGHTSGEQPTNEGAGVPTNAITFETNIRIYKFSASGKRKIEQAADLIKEVVASEEFKNHVLNHRYNGKKQFANNNGLTNKQIYHKILEGAEQLRPAKDNEMDLDLELYTDNGSNTVGYTYPNTNRIWMNSKYFNKNTPALVTTNMMHEWLHKLGFGHDVEATARRPYSVPYAIGYIVRDLAKKL